MLTCDDRLNPRTTRSDTWDPAQSVLFIAIFNGLSIIWERGLGIIHKFLTSPMPRMPLVLGKARGGVRALIQAAVVRALQAIAHLNPLTYQVELRRPDVPVPCDCNPTTCSSSRTTCTSG